MLLPSIDEARQSLSPDDYRKYLQATNLRGLVLETLGTSVDREVVAEAEAFELKVEREFHLDAADAELAELLLKYTIRAVADGKQALRIKAAYRLQLEVPEELPTAFFTIYGQSSADMQVWPFLRELAHSLTSRMEVPRLVLPLLLNPAVLNRKRKPPRQEGSG